MAVSLFRLHLAIFTHKILINHFSSIILDVPTALDLSLVYNSDGKLSLHVIEIYKFWLKLGLVGIIEEVEFEFERLLEDRLAILMKDNISLDLIDIWVDGTLLRFQVIFVSKLILLLRHSL